MLFEYFGQAAFIYAFRELIIVLVGLDMIDEVRDMNIDLGRDDNYNRWR